MNHQVNIAALFAVCFLFLLNLLITLEHHMKNDNPINIHINRVITTLLSNLSINSQFF